MNIEQAKQIPLEDVLEKLGHMPQRQMGQQLWYLSPLRTEKTPSFKVNRELNQWYDFGDGRHGDMIDLVQHVCRCRNVSETLQEIARLVGEVGQGRPPPRIATSTAKSGLELVSIGPVKSRSLLHYLRQRGIEPKLAAPFVQEARYRLPGKEREYFALAFANDAGGYELRNPYQKLTLGRKDITTVVRPSDKCLVFEGFFDYLAFVMMQGGPPPASVIVLNSVSLQERAVSKLREMGVKQVDLYRDRDAGGERVLSQFKQALPGVEIVDRSGCYAGYNDLAEWYAAGDSNQRQVAR